MFFRGCLQAILRFFPPAGSDLLRESVQVSRKIGLNPTQRLTCCDKALLNLDHLLSLSNVPNNVNVDMEINELSLSVPCLIPTPDVMMMSTRVGETLD